MGQSDVVTENNWAEAMAFLAGKLLESREAGLPDPAPDKFLEQFMTRPPVEDTTLTRDTLTALSANVTSARRTGKSSLGKAFSEFLNTPGYSSEEAGKMGGHDAYMKHMRSIGMIKPLLKEVKPRLTGKEADLFIMDEITQIASPLGEVADKITQFFIASPTKLMLNQPSGLTVKRANGQFSKKPHIGGEEFVPIRAYVGKRGLMIYAMRPADAADYIEAEFTEKQANELFDGFAGYMRSAPDLRDALDDAKKTAADAAEREKLAGKAEQYAELGFGSW